MLIFKGTLNTDVISLPFDDATFASTMGTRVQNNLPPSLAGRAVQNSLEERIALTR